MLYQSNTARVLCPLIRILLQQEIVKLLANGAMTADEIKNRLNGQPAGWDVSLDDVFSALRRLEGQLVVECLWRINQTPIQT